MAVYRLALRSYPADFRARFAADLAETFEDQIGARQRLGGAGAVWRTVPGAIRDLLVHGFRERLEALGLIASSHTTLRPPQSPPRSVNRMLDSLVQDLRYAFRSLTRARSFSLIVIATLALGIGATTTVFTAVNGILFQPLPFPDGEELVLIWYTEEGQPRRPGAVGAVDVEDWRAMNESFTDIGMWRTWRATLSEVDVPQSVTGARVSHAFAEVLRMQPALGRAMAAEDDRAGAPNRVWLSHQFWQEQFGGDPDLVGSHIRLNGAPWEVVGIMGREFALPRVDRPDVLAPLRIDISQTNRGSHNLRTLARLRPGVSIEAARADILRIDEALELEYPSSNLGLRGWVRSVHEDAVADVSQALYLLLGAVGFVLLVSIANVANLMLARLSTRDDELAVRGALGAGTGRIARQLLSESLLLAVAGGGIGLVLASWGTEALRAFAPVSIPRLEEVALDGRVLAFAGLLTLVSGAVFGFVPALRRRSSGSVLRSSRGSTMRGSERLRRLLVVGQVAMALVLLVGSGLLINSFARLLAEDPGIDPAGILTARLALGAEYASTAAHHTFFAGLLQQIQARPEVEDAAAVFLLPFAGGQVSGSFGIPDRPDPEVGDAPYAQVQSVSETYFSLLQTPLLRGRYFAESDGPASQNVAIINATAARLYWPDEDPIGKRVQLHIELDQQSRDRERTIVGVVADAKQAGLDQETEPFIYAPYRQYAVGSMYLMVKPRGEPTAFVPTLRAMVKAADPDLALYRIGTLVDVMGRTVQTERFSMLLLSGFAASALLLGCIGIYGLIAFNVARRTREIGVRMALGATHESVLLLVLRDTAAMVGAGLVAGVAASLALGRVIEGLLYEVSANDPMTLVATTLVLATLGLVAGLAPARRAARVHPAVALRSD
jgi:putative ABC transport system permease protein